VSKSLEDLTDEELMTYESDKSFASESNETEPQVAEENEVTDLEVSAPELEATEEESVDGSEEQAAPQETIYDDDQTSEEFSASERKQKVNKNPMKVRKIPSITKLLTNS